MNLIEALLYVFGFFVIYGTAVFVVWGIDTALKKTFGKGLLPRGYWW
jgi:hypothetical protein